MLDGSRLRLGRRAGIAARTVALCVVGALTVLVLTDGTIAQQRPWDMAPGQEKSARFPVENLDGALPTVKRILDKKSVKPGDVDEAISKLREAVSAQPKPMLNMRARSGVVEKEYLPYFMLAVLFRHKQQFQEAGLCVEESQKFGVAAKSREYRSEVPQLYAWGQAIISAQEYVALADAVKGVEGRLTPAGKARMPAVDQARTEINRALGSGGNAQGAFDALSGAVAQLIGDEMAALSSPLTKVAGQNLGPAFETAVPASCAAVSGSQTAAALQTHLARLSGCRADVDGELERVATAACRRLRDQRQTLTGAGFDQAAAIPSFCTDPGSASGDDVVAAGSISNQYAADMRTVEEQLREQREEWTARYRDVPATVPAVSAACQESLGIRANAEALARMKRQVESAVSSGDLSALQGLGDIDQQIEAQKTQLVQRALQTADRLYGERSSYGEFASRFDALPAARQGLQSGATDRTISALCAAASQANDGKSAYFAKNREKMKPRRDAVEQMLRFARSWRDEVRPGTLDCLDGSLSALPGNVSDPARVDRAIVQANACMAEYRAAHDEWVEDLGGRLDQVATALPAGGDVPAIVRLRDEVGELKQTTDRLQPLFASGATDTTSMQGRLDALDLSVPASRWSAIEGLISDSEREAALLTVRDEAAQASFQPIVRWLTTRAPVVDRLASFAVLNRAFDHYAAGDLDSAVRILRDDLHDAADTPDAATKQAALAFFLHTKWAAERARAADDVAQLLLADARAAGEQVYTLQANFELPSVLAGRDAFETFMSECRDSLGG